jgi:hypothetical protein
MGSRRRAFASARGGQASAPASYAALHRGLVIDDQYASLLGHDG